MRSIVLVEYGIGVSTRCSLRKRCLYTVRKGHSGLGDENKQHESIGGSVEYLSTRAASPGPHKGKKRLCTVA